MSNVQEISVDYPGQPSFPLRLSSLLIFQLSMILNSNFETSILQSLIITGQNVFHLKIYIPHSVNGPCAVPLA